MNAVQQSYLVGFVKAAKDVGISAHDMANIMEKSAAPNLSQQIRNLFGETGQAFRNVIDRRTMDSARHAMDPMFRDGAGGGMHQAVAAGRGRVMNLAEKIRDLTLRQKLLAGGATALGAGGVAGAGYGIGKGVEAAMPDPTLMERLFG